jgi:hypothetical protein
MRKKKKVKKNDNENHDVYKSYTIQYSGGFRECERSEQLSGHKVWFIKYDLTIL